MLRRIVALSLFAGRMSCALGQAGPVEILTFDGRCRLLTIEDRDVTAGCVGRMTVPKFPDGRRGFVFSIDDGTIVSFTGLAPASRAPGGMSVIRADTIGLLNPSRSLVLKGRGQCSTSNLVDGPARIFCIAVANERTYSASFETDGRPPDRLSGASENHPAKVDW